MSSNQLVKTGIAVGIAALLDKYVMGVDDLQRNLIFGSVSAGSLFAGTFASQLVAPAVSISGGNSLFQNKTIAERAVELSVGSAVGYAVNRYALNNDYNPSEMTKRIGCLALTDLTSEYISDYIFGQPLDYLSTDI